MSTNHVGRVVACLVVAICLFTITTSDAIPTCGTNAARDLITPSNPDISTFADGDQLKAAITTATSQPSTFVALGCSEKVQVFSQSAPYTGWTGYDGVVPGVPNTDSWPRVNCPHDRVDLVSFSSLFPRETMTSNATVRIPSGSHVLLFACDLPSVSQTDPTWIFYRIIVSANASLILGDDTLTLRAREIVVEAGGEFLVGAETCRMYSAINLYFHGTKLTSDHPSDPSTAGLPSKGLVVSGTVEVHGKQFFPTWTRLARSNKVNDSIIYLQEAVNWEVGQQVLITTTILLDCDDSYASPWCQACGTGDASVSTWPRTCKPTRQQNEIATIRALIQSPALPSTSTSRFSGLVLDRNLSHVHYAGIEYQAEVALISRRIQFEGERSEDDFGGHVIVQGPNSQGRMSGVRAEAMGQKNEMARYPFHFHLMGSSVGAANSYYQECSVTNSFFRCFTIHGSNSTRLSRNTAFNVSGMCYYLEDGVEENNLLEYNLAAHIHPIFRPADGGYGQLGETFLSQPGLLIPADTSGSGFYALNAYNSWIGNAASGGWSGFAFPNAPASVGVYKGLNPAGSPWAPMARPLKKFIGNSAHSNGYHWVEHGSAFYCGAWLDYDSNGVERYNSGRNSRQTKWPNGTSSIMVFEHSKAFLVNKGISHWGGTPAILHAEMHDVRVSAMLFGSALVSDTLVTGSTPNYPGDWVLNRVKHGFQFYDTGVQSILSGVTFRNYGVNQPAIKYLDFSDHYTPQGINSVFGIVYQNVSENSRLGIDYCGPDCNSYSSMSERIYSVWDWDGSMSVSAGPTIMGSHEHWWDHSPEANCRYRTNLRVYTCDWTDNLSVGYIQPRIAGLTDGCDYASWSNCTDQLAFYTVGRMSQWANHTRGIPLSPWAGVSGLTNTGWLWRVQAPVYGIDGAPSNFIIDSAIQLAKGNFIVLAIAYPPGTTFNIYLHSLWMADSKGVHYNFPVPMAANLSVVLTPHETVLPAANLTCGSQWWSMCSGGPDSVGYTYFFDGSYLYLRIVQAGCYNRNTRYRCESAYYEAGGIHVPNIEGGGFQYIINATCAGCQVQTIYQNTTFWTVDDTTPATRFPASFGSPRVAPVNPYVTPNGVCANPAAAGSSTGGTGDVQKLDYSFAHTTSNTTLVNTLVFIVLALWMRAAL